MPRLSRKRTVRGKKLRKSSKKRMSRKRVSRKRVSKRNMRGGHDNKVIWKGEAHSDPHQRKQAKTNKKHYSPCMRRLSYIIL